MLTLLQAIEARRSVRTFTQQTPDAGLLAECGAGAGRLHLYTPAPGSRLGTYGVISGAPAYVAVLCEPGSVQDSFEAGRDGERFVLQCVRRGLGTVWLGGTFDRLAVASSLPEGDSRTVAAVIAVGYPAGRRRLVERIMQGAARSASRLPVEQLIVAGRPDAVISRGIAAARLAPSALNAQPWRFAVNLDRSVDLYGGGRDKFLALDCGIAAEHFLIAAPSYTLAPPRHPAPRLEALASLNPKQS